MPYNECEPRLHTEDEDDTAKVAAAAQATCARVANLVRIKIATDMWTHHALYQAGMVDEDLFFSFRRHPEPGLICCGTAKDLMLRRIGGSRKPLRRAPSCRLALPFYGIAPGLAEDYERLYWPAHVVQLRPQSQEARTLLGYSAATSGAHREVQRSQPDLARQAIAARQGLTVLRPVEQPLPSCSILEWGRRHYERTLMPSVTIRNTLMQRTAWWQCDGLAALYRAHRRRRWRLTSSTAHTAKQMLSYRRWELAKSSTQEN